MKKVMFGIALTLFLSFGSLPLFWPLPEAGNVYAAETDPNTEALNNYLQSQQQKKAAQQQEQQAEQQAQSSNATPNQKVVWPWWLKVFSGAMVLNSVLTFFALAFGLAALWKWLALKK